MKYCTQPIPSNNGQICNAPTENVCARCEKPICDFHRKRFVSSPCCPDCNVTDPISPLARKYSAMAQRLAERMRGIS